MDGPAHIVAVCLDAGVERSAVVRRYDVMAPVAAIGVAFASATTEGERAVLAFEGSELYRAPEGGFEWASSERGCLDAFAGQIADFDAPLLLTIGGEHRDLQRLRNRCAVFCVACPPLADERLLGWSFSSCPHIEMTRLIGGAGRSATSGVLRLLETLMRGRGSGRGLASMNEEQMAVWMLLAFARLLGASGRADFETMERFEQKLRGWSEELGGGV